MQVGTLAIQHLFEKDVHYRVPLYQRPYVWTKEEQWQPLWDDLRRLAEVILVGSIPRYHFLGASVQDRPPVPPGQIETRLLIDGQQRMTTIQILLRAFEDVVRQNDNEKYRKAINKLVRNNHPLSTQRYEDYKVWPTNADRDDFEKVMECEGRNDLLRALAHRSDTKKTGSNIPDAYLYFHDVITEWLHELSSLEIDRRVAALYSAIRDNVRLVVIDLDEKDDAQLIFETLNARGSPLLASDLVKNSLLNEMQSDGEDAEAAYQKYWLPFDRDGGFWRSEVGRGHAKRARIEVFFQHSLTLLTGDAVAAGHLYTSYRDHSVSDSAGTPLSRLKSFHKYGEIFKRLQDWDGNKRIKLFLERLTRMDVGTAYPFLLKLFEILENNEELLIAVLEDLESFLVRRMVCRLSTRGYNRLFVDLLETLKGDVFGIQERIRSDLDERTAEFDRWPTDNDFRKSWVENPLYENLSRPRLRLLLEAMEAGLRTKYSETDEVPRNLTVEHVLPQSWEAHWPIPPEEDHADASRQRGIILHTIGNLTLLNGRLNPAQSNKPWRACNEQDDGKRKALRDHSVMFLNKDLSNYESWDESTIHDRSLALFEIAKETWPRL